ncbi:MAG: bifunctional adenosylcobinamide kinase/adenosylcobinamide-phosphate guanylyltransferase [Gammaproteobacteria bacterium]|jgi:adenosylcobinamide kinase/adenosylcobinamide-phosphate guanylyltransferase
MNRNILVIGGCRSGKTAHALALADSFGVADKTYIATCVPLDQEMRERVDTHRRERGEGWITRETPLALAEVIMATAGENRIILVDCLTLWLSNLLMEGLANESLEDRFRELAKALGEARGPIILVSNEVGAGIVPENTLARRFRDLAGKLNQIVAGASDQVVWMVAGIAVPVKSQALK